MLFLLTLLEFPPAHLLLMLLPALALTFTFRLHVVVAEVELVAHLWPEVAPNMLSIWVGCCVYLDWRIRAAPGGRPGRCSGRRGWASSGERSLRAESHPGWRAFNWAWRAGRSPHVPRRVGGGHHSG